MKKIFFASLVIGVSLTPVFATQARADSLWAKILNLFHKTTPALERSVTPSPVPTPTPAPIYVPTKASTKIPAKVPIKVPTTVPAPAPVKTVSEVGTTTATTTESATELVATSTVSAPSASSSEPVFLSPGSISFIVSSPASSAKSGTLTAYPGTRITIWWEVPDAAHACTNSWGYPFINANNNKKTGTDVFPDTTTIYSISCTNGNDEIIDSESVKVEIVPLTGASIGTFPILTMWGLFKSLFVSR